MAISKERLTKIIRRQYYLRRERRRLGLTGPASQRLLGSEATRSRARKAEVIVAMDGWWVVRSGSGNIHYLTTETLDGTLFCDCLNFERANDKCCSHVLCLLQYEGIGWERKTKTFG